MKPTRWSAVVLLLVVSALSGCRDHGRYYSPYDQAKITVCQLAGCAPFKAWINGCQYWIQTTPNNVWTPVYDEKGRAVCEENGAVPASYAFPRVGSRSSCPSANVTPNPSIERTSQRPLRALWSAAHVER
jgi:hypothetical protein